MYYLGHPLQQIIFCLYNKCHSTVVEEALGQDTSRCCWSGGVFCFCFVANCNDGRTVTLFNINLVFVVVIVNLFNYLNLAQFDGLEKYASK